MTQVTVLQEVEDFLASGNSHFINGQLLNLGQQKVEVENPATKQVVGHFSCATELDVDSAVNGAYQTFIGSWHEHTPEQRQNLLFRFAELIEENVEQLAQIEVLCTGKNINVARFEMMQSVSFTKYYAGWATKITGETLQPSLPSIDGEQYQAFTRREPIGVVGAILPWNFPIMIAIWKIAAALAVGCTVVAKPSNFTPFSLLWLAKLAFQAGLPSGAFNVVNGQGSVLGDLIIKHPLIAKVSFTGSINTGKLIAKSCIEANLTRYTLELGGKNPIGFMPDMSAEEIIPAIIQSAFTHQGQICASAERVYIHEAIIDEVSRQLPAALAALKIGSPLDESNNFGTLSNKQHYEKVLSYFAEIKRDPAIEVIYGAEKANIDTGYYVKPTVLKIKNHTNEFICEETFGPIVAIAPYRTEMELIHLMNSSKYGLTASIWTHNYSAAMRLAAAIKTGMLWINTHLALDPAVPFGGIKGSGIGREFGSAFIDSYTELKSVIMKVDKFS